VSPTRNTAGAVSGEAGPAVTPEARRALWGSAVGYAMDGFDLLILGFLLKPVSAALGLGPAQAASLVTATLAGAVLGGVAFGLLADRVERVRVLSWTIALFALFTGLCAVAQTYPQLLTFRGVAGLGLGGEFGIGMTLVAETWPDAMRARASSYVGLGWQAGVLAAALLAPVLIPTLGWRGTFAVGALPALVAFAVRRALREPAAFATRLSSRAFHAPLRALLADAASRRASLGMLVLCSVQNFGYYGVMVWLPNYLSARFHYGLTQSALWTAVSIAGMAAGIWAFGQCADRIGRRPCFAAWMAGAAVMVVIYARLASPLALLAGGAVMGFFVNGMLGGYGALISELYPTEARATAQNLLFNLGRAVGGFGPVAVGAVAAAHGFATAIALLAVLYGVDLVALLLLIPERRGMALR
jgi:MFS family permease